MQDVRRKVNQKKNTQPKTYRVAVHEFCIQDFLYKKRTHERDTPLAVHVGERYMFN
jgi:hypothetical protein